MAVSRFKIVKDEGKSGKKSKKNKVKLNDIQLKEANNLNRLRKSYEPVAEGVETIKKYATSMDMLRVQMEGTLNPEDKKRVRSEMKDMSKLSTEIARSIGSFLKHQKSLIEKENSQPGGGVTKQIRANLYAAHTKSFHEAMQEYNRATIAFKDAVNDRTKRQLRYALDEKFSDEDIDKIIENGEAEKVLQQEVLTDDMESTLDNIKDRHEDVLALEKQVQEVFELFQDLAVIVDEHQDTMDSIEGRIHNSKNYVEHAHKDLVQAEDYLDKANKYKCIIVGVIMFTMCCILLPIIL